MLFELPPSRARFFPSEDPPVLHYGVALLSSAIALVLTVYSPLVETRLLVFALAVMVGAWFGGWKPGLTTTAFCVLGDAYFFLPMQLSRRAFKDYLVHLALFALMALLICAFNAALPTAQQAVKASEANSRSLVENAPYGICRCEVNGQLVEANPALIAMLGFRDAGELLRRNLAADIDRDQEQREVLLERFRSGRRFDKVEMQWTRQNGSAIVVRVSGRPIRDTHKTVSFELYAEDITKHPAPAGPFPGHETILVVEDEPQLRDLTCQFLASHGYGVLVAENGAAAIDVAQRHSGNIDLLLTDIIMPVMNGRELAQRMALLRPQTRILFVSGYTENAVWRNGMIESSVNFLQKPFTLDALTRKVRAVLETSTLETEKSKMPSTKHHAIAIDTSLPLRAPRFTLRLPVHYRLCGETVWRHGTTENISRSGVLFRTDQPLEPNARLEFSVELPTNVFGMAATEIQCRCEIVRQVDPAQEGTPPVLAARILDYQIHRTGPLAAA